MNGLHIIWQNQTSIRVDQQELEHHLLSVLRHLEPVGRVNIEVTLVGDNQISKLKQQFFGLNEPTDVLSFPSDGSNDLTGSLAISLETAGRQAENSGISLLQELKMLMSHGLLHLLGYHHR